MADERRMDVLRAIVEDYVHDREPVGSKMLSERHRLGVSPATIRNDMAALEEQGYITQPHTSAGRIPTDAGYRLFVDELATVKPLSASERRAIERLLSGAVDLDDILHRTVHALAQLTRQVAVVQYPSLSRSALRHVELVDMQGGRLLVVIITDNGRVEQRILELDKEPGAGLLARVRARLNEIAGGNRLDDLRQPLADLVERSSPEGRVLTGAVADVIIDTLTEVNEERVVLAGTANLARANVDFSGSIMPVLDAIEEQVVLLKLLGEMSGDAGEVAVRIGRENTQQGLQETSMVATGYADGSGTVATLGILGPTRMDYPTTIAAVRAVARYISGVLSN